MITAAQLRAARGLVDWTRNELAKAANISPETVKNIEHGIFRPQEETSERITRTFAAQGVEFTGDEGVKKVTSGIVVLEGHEGFKAFMDDVYQAAKIQPSLDGKKSICVSNVDNNLFKKNLKEYASLHIDRMSKIEGLKIRMLATKAEENRTPGADYASYRYMSDAQSQPFYVYGDKFAIINFEAQNSPQIIVINSQVVAEAYRSQFDIMWKNASTESKKKIS